jgi:putative DNA primase/helicase
MTDLRALARRLGGEVSGPNTILCPGPGHSPKDRSLSVRLERDAPDGFVTFSHSGDDWRQCRDHVKQAWGLPRDGWKRDRPPRPRALGAAASISGNGDDRGAAAMRLWRESADPCMLIERYLASRGLDLEDDVAGRVLRWSDDLTALSELFGAIARSPSIGAMIALFRDIRTDEPRAISCTFLDREARRRVLLDPKSGREIKRKFLGPVKDAAIKLDPDEDVLAGLVGGEGIETCMAARQLDLRPTWALGSKGAIAAFPPLDGIEALTILAEPDAEREVGACAARWHAAGREVILNQAIAGKDLNDALLLRRAP